MTGESFTIPEPSPPPNAHAALGLSAEFHSIEEGLKERAKSERLEPRQNHDLPVLTRPLDLLIQQITRSLPKSPVGPAIEDALSNFDTLTRYASSGV